MNDHATCATAARGDGRARIADGRRLRAQAARMAMGPSQPSPYGAAAPPAQQQRPAQQQQQQAQYAPHQQQAQAYYGDAQSGPVYSIRSPDMPSTARRMSRAYDEAPGDARYYGDARMPSGPVGAVAGVSSNVRSTAAGAIIRRDRTVYAAPPRDCSPGGVVSHMPPTTAGAAYGPNAVAAHGPDDGYYGTAPLAQPQRQAYGATRDYAAEPPPPPPSAPRNGGGGWCTPNGGGGGNGNNNGYGAAQVQPQPTYGGPPIQPQQQQQQPPPPSSYGQAGPTAQQQQQWPQQAYGQAAPQNGQQQQQQPAYGQAPVYAQQQPQQQQQQQTNGQVGATAYASGPGDTNNFLSAPPPPQANGQFGASAYGGPQAQPIYGAQQQQAGCPPQQAAVAAAAPSAYGVQQQQPVYAQAQQAPPVAYGAVAEPQQVVAAGQAVGAVAPQSCGAVATQTVGAVAPQSFGAVATQAVGAVATQAVGAVAPQAVAVSQAVEVAGPPLSLGVPAVVPQQTVFAAAPPPQPVFAAAPQPQFFAAAPQPLLAATPVCQGRRTVSLIRHTDRGSGTALDNAALGLGPPPGSSLFEGARGPGPAYGDFYVLSRPNTNTTLSAGQAVQLTAGSTNNIGLHTGNATEIVLETCSGNPGTFKVFLGASTSDPSQFGIRVAGQSTTPHVRTFGSDTNFVAGMLILNRIHVPAIIELVLVSTDGPNGATTLPSSPGGTGEARVISLVIEQIGCG